MGQGRRPPAGLGGVTGVSGRRRHCRPVEGRASPPRRRPRSPSWTRHLWHTWHQRVAGPQTWGGVGLGTLPCPESEKPVVPQVPWKKLSATQTPPPPVCLSMERTCARWSREGQPVAAGAPCPAPRPCPAAGPHHTACHARARKQPDATSPPTQPSLAAAAPTIALRVDLQAAPRGDSAAGRRCWRHRPDPLSRWQRVSEPRTRGSCVWKPLSGATNSRTPQLQIPPLRNRQNTKISSMNVQ